MSVVFGAITPHGGEILPELAPQPSYLQATRAAMRAIGEGCRAARPDVIVVATPHGLRLAGAIAVVTSEWASGEVDGVAMEVHLDQPFAQRLAAHAVEAGLPAVGVNFGTASGPVSRVPLDWGALIPLYFIREAYAGQGSGGSHAAASGLPGVVLVGPTRDIPREQLVAFGRVLAETAAASGRRTAFIASADQAHAHDASGPYGFDPAARAYDDLVQAIVREDRLADLLQVDDDLVARALPDSLWQMLMLLGVQRSANGLRGRFLSYECPSYFGMLCAVYGNAAGSAEAGAQ